MTISFCPAAVVAAPVESVWELLSEPKLRDEWWDARTRRVVSEGKAAPGQVIYLKTLPLGRLLEATLSIERVDPEKHQIQWVLRGPGIINHQTTTCTPIDAVSCRVWMLKTFGGKLIEASVQDSLQRLKRRTEARYGSRAAEQP